MGVGRNQKKILFFGGIMLAALGVYSRIVPIGARPIPWLLARSDRHVKIDWATTAYFNDAGAMHSGDYWCWEVRDYFLIRFVAREGYQSPAVYESGERPQF